MHDNSSRIIIVKFLRLNNDLMKILPRGHDQVCAFYLSICKG